MTNKQAWTIAHKEAECPKCGNKKMKCVESRAVPTGTSFTFHCPCSGKYGMYWGFTVEHDSKGRGVNYDSIFVDEAREHQNSKM